MGSGYFSNAGVFLIDSLFGLYICAVLLRLLFQVVRADFYNPLCQAIVTVTNPVLRPLRRYIPALASIDTASVLLILSLQLLNTFLVALVVGVSPNLAGLLVVAVAEVASKTVWIFMAAVIAQIVLSWVAPGGYNPVIGVIQALSEPMLRPARRLLPPLGGLDFSAMVVVIVLNLLLMLVVAPLRDVGYSLL
jgi:YggT family protein